MRLAAGLFITIHFPLTFRLNVFLTGDVEEGVDGDEEEEEDVAAKLGGGEGSKLYLPQDFTLCRRRVCADVGGDRARHELRCGGDCSTASLGKWSLGKGVTSSGISMGELWLLVEVNIVKLIKRK